MVLSVTQLCVFFENIPGGASFAKFQSNSARLTDYGTTNSQYVPKLDKYVPVTSSVTIIYIPVYMCFNHEVFICSTYLPPPPKKKGPFWGVCFFEINSSIFVRFA